MSDYLNDPETQKHFAEIRAANERKRQLQEEQAARLRADLTKTAARMADDERRRAAERFDNALRAAFFAGNPTATDADWERLGAKFRDEYMLRSAVADTAADAPTVYDRIRATAGAQQQQRDEADERFRRLAQETYQ